MNGKRNSKKKIGNVFVLFLGFVIAFSGVTVSGKAENREPRVVRVASTNLGMKYLPDKDNPMGYAYDYLQSISERTGWKFEYVDASWADSLKMLENGEIDLVTQVQYTPERAEKFLFSEYNMGIVSAYLIAANDDDELYYNDFEAFDGKNIGILRGIYQRDQLKAFAEENHFSYNEVTYENNTDMLRDLDRGIIDMALSESTRSMVDRKVVSSFKPVPMYFVMNKEKPELMDELNDALEEIQSMDVNFHGKLHDRYYSSADYGFIAFTKEEAEFIKNHPVLKMSFNDTWNPICYRDPKTGEPLGIIKDVMALLEHETGFRFEYVPNENSKEIEKKIEEGEVDLVFGMGTDFRNEAKKLEISITKPYISIPLSLAKRNDVAFENIRSIAILENNKTLSLYLKKYYPNYAVVEYEDTQECLEAVYRGDVDAVFENVYVLNQYEKDKRYKDLEVLYSMQVDVLMGVGVCNEESIIVSILNKAISRINRSEVADIVIKNTMVAPKLHIDILVGRYIIPITFAFAVVVILSLLISKQKMRKYAFVDFLTKYPNGNYFRLSVAKAIKYKKEKDYAIVSIDIDNFKLINNMWSFAIGNRVLQDVADVIHGQLENNEFFCRKSDDHFLLCLRNSSDENFTDRLLKIIHEICQLPKRNFLDFSYTVSCGVCRLKDADNDYHRAIGWASMARKKAKKEKTKTIVFYDETLKEQAVREQNVVNRMEHALKNREFCVFYQPQIRIEDNVVVGAEALARWIRPDGTMVYPDEFIPVFEKNGFITKLDLYIFEEVCRNIRKWLDSGNKVCRISVNISQVQLKNKDFYLNYLDIMEKYDIPSECIELELTESSIYDNTKQTVDFMKVMQGKGIKIAMDDFGSGYSSLNLMKDLPIDFLKIDKEFFNTSLNSQKGKLVISSVAEMAGKLKINVVAEGVETLEQVDFLKGIKCEVVQGYYYFKPMPVDQFEKLQHYKE